MKDVAKTVNKHLNESFDFERDKFLANMELYDDYKDGPLEFGCGGYAVFNDKNKLVFVGSAKQAYNYIDSYSSPINKLVCKEVEI